MGFEVITHVALCLTSADKYCYTPQYSMRLFCNQHAHRVTFTRITGAFADYCTFVMQFVRKLSCDNSELKYNFSLNSR